MKIFSNEFKNYIKNLFHIHKWEYHQITIDSDGSCKSIVLGWKICSVCCKSKIQHILPS